VNGWAEGWFALNRWSAAAARWETRNARRADAITARVQPTAIKTASRSGQHNLFSLFISRPI